MVSKNLSLPVSSPECRIELYVHHQDAGLHPSSSKLNILSILVVLAAAGKRTLRLEDYFSVKVTAG